MVSADFSQLQVFSLAIIGAGPAGVTAAIYAKRANLELIVFTNEIVCGKVAKTLLIENYPAFKSTTGAKLCQKLDDQIAYLNIEVVHEKVLSLVKNTQGLFVLQTKKTKYLFEKVIIATGTREKKLSVKGVVEFEGRGVSYCSSCDGYFFKDQVIAVIGGGSSALEESKVLAQIGEKIILIIRDDQLHGEPILIKDIQELSNVEIKYNSVLIEAQGKEDLEKLVLLNSKTQKLETISAAGLFIYVGSLPNTQFLNSQWSILDADDYVQANSFFATKITNLYAVGDVVSGHIQQYTTAMSSATTALKDIVKKGFQYSQSKINK